MTVLVPIALWGFLPLSLLIFSILPTRRAVIATFMIGWMFLPIAGYPIRGLPDYTKISAISLGVLLGLVLIDRGQMLLRIRPSWFDLPTVVWCLSPILTSLSNGLGLYDGLSVSLDQWITYGIPYFTARAVLTDVAAVRELAIGIFIAGLIYLPLCLYEIRMSPQLHMHFYGRHQTSFVQHIRGDSYRPMVFMHHGLMLSMFMGSAAMCGLWLWSSKSLRRVMGLPMWMLALPLIAITIMCKSLAAIALLMMGLAVFAMYRYGRLVFPMLVLAMVPPIYVGARLTNAWAGEWLVPLVAEFIDADRAESLQFRIDNEVLLTEKALRQPVLGWGGYNRARLDEDTEGAWGQGVAESLWILALGEKGLLGMTAVMFMHLLGPTAVIWRLRRRNMLDPIWAPCAALALISFLKMIDNLLNAMISPVFLLALAACSSILIPPRPVAAPGAASLKTARSTNANGRDATGKPALGIVR